MKIKPPEFDNSLSSIVICDIDGTIAHMNGRGPFEWTRVTEDEVDWSIVNLLRLVCREYEIMMFSGRDEVCRNETFTWLENHSIPFAKLYMRPQDDKRKDSIVKKELYEKYIKGKYNVGFILDDRNQVVEMWRSLGLKCLQVADGNF